MLRHYYIGDAIFNCADYDDADAYQVLFGDKLSDIRIGVANCQYWLQRLLKLCLCS